MSACIPSGDREPSSSPAETPRFPIAAASAYNSVSLCISDASVLLVTLVFLPCYSLFHTSLSPLFPTANTPFHILSPCVFPFHSLILMSFLIPIVSFAFPQPHLLASLPGSPPPPICCLCSFSFSLVHLHSCSPPCHTLSLLFRCFLSHPSLSCMLSSLTLLSAC